MTLTFHTDAFAEPHRDAARRGAPGRETGARAAGAARLGRAWRLVRRAALSLVALALLVGGFLFGGFLRFAEEVSHYGAPPAAVGRADGIVVLTGGALRLDAAFDLLKRGLADRLLVSGVNPGTGVDALSHLTRTPRELFDCCVDLDYMATNTIGNAEMATRWADARGFDDLIVVTSDYHMPRSLREFERLGPGRVLKPVAVTRPDLWSAPAGPTGTGLRILVTEYLKLVMVRLRDAAGLSPEPAAPHTVAELPASEPRRTR